MKIYLTLGLIIVGLIASLMFTSRLYFKAEVEKELVTKSFNTYANNVNKQAIEDNNKLSELYGEYDKARQVKKDNLETLKTHDIDKIIKKHPDVFAHAATDSYDRLFNAIEQASQDTTESSSSSP